MSPRKLIYLGLGCDTAIALAEFAAAAVSGSAAMVGDAIQTTADIGNQLLLLYGLKRAVRPADEHHPFGYGKEVYFWCFVIAIEIFTVGAGATLARGIWRLEHPEPETHLLLNYGVLAIALLFEGLSWVVAVRQFSRSKGRRTYIQAVRMGKDPSRFTVLFEDTSSLVGVLIAAAGIGLVQLTHDSRYDAIASILIALVLAVTAVWLAYETKGLLIGESASPQVISDIRRIASEIAGIKRVHEVLSMHVGPDFILVGLTLELDAARSRGAIDRLERLVKRAHPAVKRFFARVRKTAMSRAEFDGDDADAHRARSKQGRAERRASGQEP